ncbi:MAG TPA: aldehyde dehydrogenase family protein [archaeon]|nr:aldehyde dehydrogenase family protein [archaeon]
MEFKNENTFAMDEVKLDKNFDKAVKKVQKSFGKHYPMYINGKSVNAAEEIKTISPIDGRITIGYFQRGNLFHTRKAIDAAKEALQEWQHLDWMKRIKIMRKAADVISDNKFDIAAIVSFENGKTRGESIGEVDEAIDFLRYYSFLVEQNKGFIIQRGKYSGGEKGTLGHQGSRSSGESVRIVSRPFGVWGVIAPFNFPFSISTGMSAAALIMGNTVVFKPSFGDNPAPLSGLKLYEVLEKAGLPKGVFNYVTGFGKDVGEEILENLTVKGVAFTGSRDVGMSMLKKSVNMNVPKQFVMEMGSKNPVIVCEDADVSKAVNGVASAAFGFCGQKCSACSRVLVHENIYDKFISNLIERVRIMKIGNPLEKDVYVGPIIGKTSLESFLSTIEKAKAEGRVSFGGRQIIGSELYNNGFYVEPTIIEVNTSSEIFHKELFLPILAIVKYKKFEEAIGIANDTEYGLTAGLYTNDKKKIDFFNKNIEYGTTYVNRDVSATTGAVVGQQTFVGCKGSSLGCKGTSSLSYLLQFVREHSETTVEPQSKSSS